VLGFTIRALKAETYLIYICYLSTKHFKVDLGTLIDLISSKRPKLQKKREEKRREEKRREEKNEDNEKPGRGRVLLFNRVLRVENVHRNKTQNKNRHSSPRSGAKTTKNKSSF